MDRVGTRPNNLKSVKNVHNNVCPTTSSGLDYLRDARLFKGMAFSLEERQALGIHGLLPPRVKTQDEQVKNCLSHSKIPSKLVHILAVKRSIFSQFGGIKNQLTSTCT